MSVPPEHARALPHVNISEQGLRELELWLRSRPGSGSGIRFNVDNEGGWLYVQTNECVDIDVSAPDPIAEGGDWGLVLEDDSGCGLLIGANQAPVQIKGRQAPVGILADGNDDAANSLNLSANQTNINITADKGLGTLGNINIDGEAITTVQRANSTYTIHDASETLIFKDSAGNPILTLTG